MSNCVEKLAHSCGSNDGLQVFEEGGEYTGYCFACGTYVDDPYTGLAFHSPPKVKIKTEGSGRGYANSLYEVSNPCDNSMTYEDMLVREERFDF